MGRASLVGDKGVRGVSPGDRGRLFARDREDEEDEGRSE